MYKKGMNPRFLRTFLRVASSQSITRAASELNLAQPTVSDQIQTLESELGTALFLRSRLGLQTTAAGEALIAHAQDVLAALDRAREAVSLASLSRKRSITIGALETVATEVLPRPLADLRRVHPDLRIRIEVAGSTELLKRLHDGRIDVAFYFRRDALDGMLVRRAYTSAPLVLIGPPAARATGELRDWRALATMPFVTTEPGCIYRRLFDEAWRKAGAVPPEPSAEVGSIGAIVRLVVAGSGFALVPRLAASREIERGTVDRHQWPGGELAATLDMVWRRRRVQPPDLGLFLGAMRDAERSLRRGDARPRHAAPYPS